MKINEILFEGVQTALLSWSAKIWYVHFFKELAHGQAIINTGIIKPGEDGVVWAIQHGQGYNVSQIETDYETGKKVKRAGAIIFAPFDKPYVDIHNLSAWRTLVQCATAYLVDVATGKAVCNSNIDKIPFIKSFEYGV